MAIETALIAANVMHKRLRPREHAFNYKVYYLCFSLSKIKNLSNRFLSQESWNLLSFYKKDHGARDGSDLEVWIRSVLSSYGIQEADGEIVLLTLPRILGYIFNPVSFWFCFDKNDGLRAVLSEVSNTFGEHHSYICYHDDHRIIGAEDLLRAEKVFHVSPFMDLKGYYLFRFQYSATKVSAIVNYFDEQGLLLATSISGSPAPLTAVRTIKYLIRFPLMTFKVIGLIHWEAIRIILKGIRYRSKPPCPVQEVSR